MTQGDRHARSRGGIRPAMAGIFFLLLPAVTAGATTDLMVLTSDGSMVEGRLLSADASSVTLTLPDGKGQRIQAGRIRRIFDDQGNRLSLSDLKDGAGGPNPQPTPSATAPPTSTPTPTSSPTSIPSPVAETMGTAAALTAVPSPVTLQDRRKMLLELKQRSRQERRLYADERAKEQIATRKKDRVGFELGAGYSSFTMASVDHYFGAPRILNDAVYSNLDLNVDFLDGQLALGPRVQYVMSIDDRGISTVLYPVLLGVQYRSQTWVQVQAGVNGGYAWAYVDNKLKNYVYGTPEGMTPLSSDYTEYTGGAPVAEGKLGLRLGQGPVHFGLDCGYRWAVVESVSSQGTVFTDEKGKTLEFDYSGWSAGCKLSADF